MLLKPPSRGVPRENLTRHVFTSDFLFTGHLPASPFDLILILVYLSLLELTLSFATVQAVQKGAVPRQALHPDKQRKHRLFSIGSWGIYKSWEPA